MSLPFVCRPYAAYDSSILFRPGGKEDVGFAVSNRGIGKWGGRQHVRIRRISSADDARLAQIIRASLRDKGLDIPGTAYFDPELDHLSAYYLSDSDSRRYLVLVDENDLAVGGVGLSCLSWDPLCAEVQKLYLAGHVKGRGLGRTLMGALEREARAMGFSSMYLETHSSLKTAISLYRSMGYTEVERPEGAIHSAMDCFMRKEFR